MRRRAALTCLAVIAVLAQAGPAAAQSLPAGGWETLRVGVLPVRSYAREPEDVFLERPQARALREAAGLWQRRLEALVGRRDQVEVLPASQVRELLARTRGHREAVDLAAERFALGRELYGAIETDGALKQLDRAAELYREAGADATLPRELADVELYRGLAWAERKELNRAHIAFREMFLLDPGRVIQKGYYPEEIERALAGAQLDLTRLPDKVIARYPLARLSTLASALEVDVWVVALLEGTPDAPVLHVAIFDVRSGALTTSERIPLGEAEVVAERVDRALAVWHACALAARDTGSMLRPQRPARWGVEVGYAHVMMLRHRRTRALFHSPGVSIGATWDATRSAHVFARALHMVSLPDDNADLYESFLTSRLVVGGGLSGGTRDVRLFVEAGLEVGFTLQDIRMTTDVDCKHFGADHPRCTRLSTVEAPGVWFGLKVGLGARVRLSDVWYGYATAQMSSYVLEAELVGDLNFPLGLGVGVGHRF